jgi:hypothetical protein
MRKTEIVWTTKIGPYTSTLDFTLLQVLAVPSPDGAIICVRCVVLGRQVVIKYRPK